MFLKVIYLNEMAKNFIKMRTRITDNNKISRRKNLSQLLFIGLMLIIIGWMQPTTTIVSAQTNLQFGMVAEQQSDRSPLTFKQTAVSRSVKAVIPFTYPPTQEVWPPFWFDLIPAYENGKIIYTVALFSRVDWPMPNLTIKIPLPEGTRFVEAKAPLDVQAGFDGQNASFFAPAFDGYFEGNSFTVEVIDPAKTIFTTQAWINWEGERQGSYQAEVTSFDITRKPLNWVAPSKSLLQLGTGVVVAGNTITYTLYPKAMGRERMWDVKINLPLPEGTTFLAVNAPPSFTTGFDGREISFNALELMRQAEPDPLTISLSTPGITTPEIATHVWANWKNAIFSKEASIPGEEQQMIDLVVKQPNIPQQAVFDQAGDVPLANYDLTSIAFQEQGPLLAIIFNTAGTIGPVGQPLEYALFIDSDCNSSTGELRINRGAEYQVRYNHQSGRAVFLPWEAETKEWAWSYEVELKSLVRNDQITLFTPLKGLGLNQQFCWAGRASNRTTEFNPDPPPDWLPNEAYQGLTRYKISEATEATATGTPSATGITGKLAIPLTNAQGLYDVHLFTLPNGQEITAIPNTHQPHFRFDGQRLLLNHESSGEKKIEYNSTSGGGAVLVLKDYKAIEGIYEYNLVEATEKQVTSMRGAAYPFYNLSGNQLVFAAPQLSPAINNSAGSRLYVQCGLLPPEYEEKPLCQNLSEFGVLVSAGQNEIQGGYPVWTSSSKIVFYGCVTPSESATCGLYMIEAQATRNSNNNAFALQLTQNVNDIPSDTKGNWLAFTSRREGNWEAYVMNLDGTNVRNLSNNPNSNDGLPTISPDGNWVAFVSDRGSQWAVWVAPVLGGSAQKLFDLPAQISWGGGDSAWTRERISWGP